MTGYEMESNNYERHGFRDEDYDCLDLISIISRSEWNRWSTSPKLMFNMTAFKSVMKKCPNMQCIGIQNARIGFNQSNKIVELVTKYCNKITEIYLDFNLITIRNFSKFIAKFGQTIRKCDYYSGYYLENRQCQHLLDYCPNLEQMNLLCSYLMDNYLVTFQIFNLDHSTRVKCLIFCLWLPEETKLIKKFIDNNRNSLELIHIWVQTEELNQFQVIFKELNKLPRLKSLKINFSIENEPYCCLPGQRMIKMPTFADLLCSITPFCPLVKDIEINAYSLEFQCYKIYESMQYFSGLKRLKLEFKYLSEEEREYQYRSETLRHCKQLTHLSLNVPLINKNFFTDIDSNLPKLQYLDLKTVKYNSLVNSINELSIINNLKNVYISVTVWNKTKEAKLRKVIRPYDYDIRFKKLNKLIIRYNNKYILKIYKFKNRYYYYYNYD